MKNPNSKNNFCVRGCLFKLCFTINKAMADKNPNIFLLDQKNNWNCW